MKLSITIVNWNTAELLLKSVDSVLQNSDGLDLEVVVFDNASSDNSLQLLEEKYSNDDRVKVIRSQTNLGFGKANNRAVDKSSGEYVMLLNPDTEVRAGALSVLVKALESDEAIGAVGPRLENPDGSLQPSVRRFPGLWSSLLVFSGLHRVWRPSGYLMDDFDYERKQDVDQVMGAALMTRRSLIDEIGLFDEGFYLWYEEVDFCKRVKDADLRVVYEPGATVMHHTAQSFSKLRVWSRKKTVAKSLLHYFRKHHSVFAVLILFLTMIPILTAAWLVNLFKPNAKIRV